MIEMCVGFVVLIGEFNVGKFILLNQMVGVKVLIVMYKVQMICVCICGIVMYEDL